jgi:hypothetical protein
MNTSHINYKKVIRVLILSLLFTIGYAQGTGYLDKGGIAIDGLVSVRFPTPQQINDHFSNDCNLQAIDAITFPVMCQQTGGFIFEKGKNRITNLGIKDLFAVLSDPFGLNGGNEGPRKKVAIGLSLMIGGATIIATCPPISVEEGFHDLSFFQKLSKAQAFGYVPPFPPNFDRDVDNPTNPLSCTASLDISIDSSTNVVTNFNVFEEREFAYVFPFGSYPSAERDLQHLEAENAVCIAGLASLVDISFGSGLSGDFGDVPGPNVSLNDIFSGLTGIIDDAVGMVDFEVIALAQFNSWKNSYRQNHPSYCTNNTCQFEHGFSRMTFYEDIPANAWGNVSPKLEYYQDINVMEYFNPEITALPLEVHLEALETGGVTVNAYPPRSFTGTPPANKHYTFDKSWLGILDNCTTKSELKLDFPIANFYPLGNWDIPITVTDRVGNVTTDTMRIVVEDSIPPDLLPLDAVGIPIADGTSVINFNDPGIGCVTNLCEGFPSTKYLHPPVYFDFASISPDIECFVDNVLNMNLVPCTVAQLPVNDVSLIIWSIADPSGNVTEIVQEVFVREQSFNQIPTVQDVTYTIGQNAQVLIPLSGNDADYDPLSFNVINQPTNGNLDAQVEAIFQTRFTTSGMIRSASGMLDVSINGASGILLSVADEKRLYAYQGDVFSIGGEVVNRYNLTITPSAISMTDSKYINSSQDSLYQVLRPTSTESGVWIADWIARKIYRYTYNDLSNSTIEKEIFSLPAGLQQPVGLSIETAGSNYQVMIADQQDNELWKFELSRTGSGSLNNQTYTLISSIVVATLPFKVDSISKFNTGNNETDFGKMLIASWSAKKLDVFDWNDLTPSSYWSWDIGVLLDDPDGPNNPGLPILMDPRDVVFVSDGSQVRIKFFDQTEMKYVEKDFNKSTLLVSCGGGSNGPDPIYCSDPERDVLRLPAMVDILAIEEFNGLIYVLDRNTIGYQHLYRFDLAGRLDAVINLYDFAPSPSSYPPISQTEFIDFSLMDNGNILLLEAGDSNNVPSVSQLTVLSGVDSYSVVWSVGINMNTSNYTVALDVNATNIVVLMQKGFVKIPLTDRFNQTQITTYTLADIYSDLTLSNNDEIFASNIKEAPFSHVSRFQTDSTFINFIGDDDNDGNFELDFNLDSNYGKVYFDNALNKLWVTDYANIFYPDLGVNGETHRMPRISAYAPDGTLLERLIPNGDPNDFFSFLEPGDFGSITSMSVGPDRFYVAENAPLHRLHVFDTTPFIPVTCTNLPEGEVCQQIGYTPDNGFTGTETFTYASSDPFSASSNTATVTINVINDTQAPILSCPNSIQLEMNNALGFVAELTEPEKEPNETMRNFLLGISVSENTDLPLVTATHNIPVALPLGQTTVVYSATDGSNNTGTCQTIISVVDTTAPQMTTTSNLIVEATGLTTPFVDVGIVPPTVSDFSGFMLTNDAPTDFSIGESKITWTATDSQGNITEQTQQIKVRDTTPPEFTVAQISSSIFGTTITTAIAYTPPQASDVVGVDDAGVVCLPHVGTMIPMGPNLVQCHASDNYGNKISSSFVIDYYDVDAMGEGIVDVLETGNGLFADTINGGMTTGSIDYPENINWQFKIYEAPTIDTGVVIAVNFAPQRSGQTTNGVASAIAHACNDKVIMDNLNIESTIIDGSPFITPDVVGITCTANGYNLNSKLGTNDFILTLPDSSVVTASIPFNNKVMIDGWFAIADAQNSDPIQINIQGHDLLIHPNQTFELKLPELLFANGFE